MEETKLLRSQVNQLKLLDTLQNTENYLHAQINKHRRFDSTITNKLAKNDFYKLRPSTLGNFDEPRTVQEISRNIKIMHLNIKGKLKEKCSPEHEFSNHTLAIENPLYSLYLSIKCLVLQKVINQYAPKDINCLKLFQQSKMKSWERFQRICSIY